jgi:hypothetical protein
MRDQHDNGGNHWNERVLDDRGDARAIGGDAPNAVADGFVRVKTQRELLKLGEQICSEIIGHALAETDVRVSGEHAHGPA